MSQVNMQSFLNLKKEMNLMATLCQMWSPTFFTFCKQNNNKNPKKAGNCVWQSVVAVKLANAQIRKPNDCSKYHEPSKFVCSVFQCVFSIHKMEAIAWRSVSNFVGDAVMRLHFLPIMSKRWLCKRPDWREAQLSSALLSSLCLGSTGTLDCSVLRIWV